MAQRKEVVSDFLENKKQDTQDTRDYNAGVQRREKDGKVMRAYNQYNKQGTATKAHTYRTATLQIVMWLMAFVTMFILALQPILQSRNTLVQAGLTSNNQYYANAPMTVIGGSVDESTHTINDGTKPLFTANGVNADVLMELLNAVNSSSVWGSKTAPTSGSSVTYLSAKDCGQYGDQSAWADTAKGNAQIVLKLLDTTSNTENNVDDAAAQYWQVVYRSTSANEDILTLYMVDQYTTHEFNPYLSTSERPNGEVNSENGETYYYEGNYSQSEIRDLVVNPTYETMASTYTQLDQYVVAPSAIPGLWQSSAYQTSANQNGQYYNATANDSGASENGDYALGSSGYGSGSSYFNMANGMDGQSVKINHGTKYSTMWYSDIESAYSDKLWVPSGFEVLHTGYGEKDDGTSPLQDTGRTFDEADAISYVSSYSSSTATLTNGTSGDGRTGLWELNGYDRATSSEAWLRSGNSNNTRYARAIRSGGYAYDSLVDFPSTGVRVALHLNLKSLATNLLASGTLASISASANAPSNCDHGVSLSEGEWSQSILNRYQSWTNTFDNVQFPVIYKNSSESSVTATYTFDTAEYRMSSFTLNGTQSVTLSADSGSGTASGICDYSYQINDGNVTITISNAQTDVSIVAQIENAGYTLTYDAGTNGGTTTAQSQMVIEGASVDLSPTATKSDWDFVGWNNNPNATTGLSSFSMPGQATTLYAIFSKEITADFYQINATTPTERSVTIYNNATSGQINAPSITTSSGQTAVGWTTTPTSTTSSVKAGASVTISGGETYYAIVRYTVTISYNGNGGSGNTGNSTGTAYLTANGTASANTTNAQITLAQNAFNRPNYTFVAWALGSASGTQYNAGSSYSTSTNATFYAVWSKNTCTVNFNITISAPSDASIIVYIIQGTKQSYSSMTQMVISSTQTVSLELAKGQVYTIIVSKPYTWQLSFSGNGAVSNNTYTFETPNSDTSTTTYGITVSGGDIPNNWWQV